MTCQCATTQALPGDQAVNYHREYLVRIGNASDPWMRLFQCEHCHMFWLLWWPRGRPESGAVCELRRLTKLDPPSGPPAG